jgi:hypothetical protein
MRLAIAVDFDLMDRAFSRGDAAALRARRGSGTSKFHGEEIVR